jgi:hypothetical protein
LSARNYPLSVAFVVSIIKHGQRFVNQQAPISPDGMALRDFRRPVRRLTFQAIIF